MSLSKTLHVTAPAGRVTDLSRIPKAQKYFEDKGWSVTLDDTIGEGFQRFGGTDALRDSCIEQACKSQARLVITARGGYGISRLLDSLDYSLLKQSELAGQRWVGYSDIAALQLAGLAKVGWKSISGPCFAEEWADDPLSQFTQDCFWGLVNNNAYSFSVAAETNEHWDVSTNPQGQWSGTVWGGNLAMVNHLLGTPYFPNIEGGILFLEDINEQPFRVERRLLQLHHAGVLEKQRAIVLGDFSGFSLGTHERGFGLQAAVEHIRQRIKVPLLLGAPFGHRPNKLSFPIGGHGVVQSALIDGKPSFHFQFSNY